MTDPLPDVEALLANHKLSSLLWGMQARHLLRALSADLQRLREEIALIDRMVPAKGRNGVELIDRLTQLIAQMQFDDERCRVWEQEVQQLQEENARLKDQIDFDVRDPAHENCRNAEDQLRTQRDIEHAEVERLTAERAGGQATPEEKG